MPLEPRSQDIPLSVALDQSDDAQGSPQGFPVVENIVWRKDGVMSKRNGFTRVQGTTFSTPNITGLVSAGPTLGIIQSDRVIPYSGAGTAAYPYAANDSSLIDHRTYELLHGGTVTCSVDQAMLTALGHTYLCVVSTRVTEATGTTVLTSPVLEVHVQVVEYATGTVLLDTALEANSFGARVVVTNNGSVDIFAIVYATVLTINTADVKFVAVTPGTSFTVSAPVTIEAAAGVSYASATMDLIRSNAGDPVLAHRASTGELSLRILTAAGATASGGNKAGTNVAGPLSLIQSGFGSQYIVATFNGANVVTHLYSAGGIAIGNTTIAASAFTPNRIAQIETSVGNQDLIVVEIQTAVLLYTWDEQVAGTVFVGDVLPDSGIITKPWLHNGNPYIALGSYLAETTGYRTTFVYRLSTNTTPSNVVGQVSFDESGLLNPSLAATKYLSTPLSPSTDERLLATLVDLETPDALNTVNVKRIRLSVLTFGFSRPIVATTLNASGYIAGSVPLQFDGTVSRVMSFLDAPSAPTVTSTASAGVLTGDYKYRVVFEFTDVHGNIQVSPPGVETATLTVSAKQIALSGTVQPHLMAATLVGQRNLRMKLYRTKNLGASYFLVRTFAVPPEGSWTVSDNSPDSDLKEGLYTTGNVLESEPVPPLRFLTAHRNRLFGIRSDTPEIIPYTQETFDPFLPRWHSALTFRLDNGDGEPTALATLSDKLVIFQTNNISAIAGQGPDSTGGNGSFSLPETVARGVGVSLPARGSVAVIPQGVVFQHATGIQLLTPDLQVATISRPVEDYLGTSTVTRARYLPSLHQCWFLVDNQILAYDVRYGRWSVFTTSMDAWVDVIEHQGVVYLCTRSQLYTYDSTTFIDDSAETLPQYSMIWETPWFRADRAQHIRLWKVHLTGTAINFADTTITLSTFIQQAENYQGDSGAPVAYYTWSGLQLSDIPPGAFVLSARQVTQRCQAFRVRVEVETDLTNDTAVCFPATVTYDFGVLPSRGKTPKAAKPTAGV